MKCPKCNEEIGDKVKFCTKCGANIEEAKKELEEKKETEKQEQEQVEEKKVNKKEKKTKKEPKNEVVEAKTEVKEEVKLEEQPKEKEEKKTEKQKSKKKIFIIIAIIIVLLTGVGAGTWYYITNKEETSEEEKVLEWGDVYLEVLNDDKKSEDLENMKISLIDLDQDKVPELVIKGTNSAKETVANVYKINDKNKVDTIKISMNDEFNLRLVYDLKKDKYVWYAVAKETTETPEVYDLNIETKKYEKEKLDLSYKNDLVIVETENIKWTDFSKELSKSERKEKLEETKKEYIETEKLITEDVEEKVELAKSIKNIEKIDSSKELVYTVRKKTAGSNIFEYPCINIKSDEITKINSEIEEKYGFKSTSDNDFYSSHLEAEEISYSYSINKNILSLLVWEAGNESTWASTYNIDLKTSKQITAEELIKTYDFKKDEITSKATKSVKEEYNKMISKEQTALGEMWNTMYGQQYVTEWENEIQKYIEELHLFVNDKNELCILGKYTHAGGQWSCTQLLTINISKNYETQEFKHKYITMSHYMENYTPAPNTSTSPSPSPQVSPSASTSTGKVSNINFVNSSIVVPEGTYKRGENGTLTIKNSKAGQFDFEIECTYMTQAGYPNIGMLSGTAKATDPNAIFAYTERKANGGYFDYNVIFTVADGETISIDEEFDGYESPYCGHNVTLEGTFKK